MRRTARRGNAAIEFTLVGIPVLFGLISIFELSRGMWEYHTLAHAIKEGARFAVVHGQGCDEAPECRVTVGEIAQRIRDRGVGLIPSRLQLEFIPKKGDTITCTLDACLARTEIWPPAGVDMAGSHLTVRGVYQVRSIILMLTPAGRSGGFLDLRLPASSTEMIQY